MTEKIHESNLDAEPGWTQADIPGHHYRTRTFTSDDPDTDRLRIRYYRRDLDGRLVAKVWFGSGTEGPPGYAHGGSIAAVLDEAMGIAVSLAGHTALTGQLTVRFRELLPVNNIAIAETEVLSEKHKTVHVRACLRQSHGNMIAKAEGVFVPVTLQKPKPNTTVAKTKYLQT